MTTPISSSHVRVTLVVDGVQWGEFMTASDVSRSGSVTKRRAGALRRQVLLKGQAEQGDVTFTQMIDRALLAKVRVGQSRVNLANISASWQPLDDTGARLGDPFTLTGVLSDVTIGSVDANDDGEWPVSVTGTFSA